jgi:hypothetical protein
MGKGFNIGATILVGGSLVLNGGKIADYVNHLIHNPFHPPPEMIATVPTSGPAFTIWPTTEARSDGLYIVPGWRIEIMPAVRPKPTRESS